MVMQVQEFIDVLETVDDVERIQDASLLDSTWVKRLFDAQATLMEEDKCALLLGRCLQESFHDSCPACADKVSYQDVERRFYLMRNLCFEVEERPEESSELIEEYARYRRSVGNCSRCIRAVRPEDIEMRTLSAVRTMYIMGLINK